MTLSIIGWLVFVLVVLVGTVSGQLHAAIWQLKLLRAAVLDAELRTLERVQWDLQDKVAESRPSSCAASVPAPDDAAWGTAEAQEQDDMPDEAVDEVRAMEHRNYCSRCKDPSKLIVHPGDETFLPRRGCTGCDRWFDPVRLRSRA